LQRLKIRRLKRITIAKGDGIGPEIMDATRKILKAAEAPIECDEVFIGEQVYLSGNTTGIPQKAWETIRKNKIF
jgi:isocitrate dehydrogenase